MKKVKNEMKRKKSERGVERKFVSHDGQEDSVTETSGGKREEEEEEERNNGRRERKKGRRKNKKFRNQKG